jgi:hypothetical protein
MVLKRRKAGVKPPALDQKNEQDGKPRVVGTLALPRS